MGLPEVRVQDLSPEEFAKAQAELPKKDIQSWMIKSVFTSLPHLTDEALVIKILEEVNGHVDNAVTKLLGAEYRGSMPSSPASAGSSSVERDPDSDDDEIYGPNKRQNRRIKAMKQRAKEEMLSGLAIPTIELTQPDTSVTSVDFTPSSLPSLSSLPPPTQLPQLSVHPKVKTRKVKKLDDDERFAPSDDGDDDYQPDGDDDDIASIYSSSSRAPSVSLSYTPPRPSPKIILHTNSKLKQQGPKRITARERKEAKKAAQKQARKTTKRDNAKQSGSLSPSASTASTTNLQRNSPPMESVIGMKTLYI
jgi:OTU domain-containing protein 3